MGINKKTKWFRACHVNDVPANGGVCIQYQNEQIAIFHFTSRQEWYATQNLCPHKQQMILSRGLIGETLSEAKVACPYHKNTFSLITGKCLSSSEIDVIKIYEIKIEDEFVFVACE
ncbi:MAG: nitrite reductase small subunit NirD [Chitinophagaceae bacterium]|jgi:nitrite reductase (NADH) small subunit|nr:MAG: nitrite reductase small subunit NirD [Chitinophagaceae bacterium]